LSAAAISTKPLSAAAVRHSAPFGRGQGESETAPTQNPSNFAGRAYQDFLAAYGLPMPQGAQGN
jgi:hypothetical protein